MRVRACASLAPTCTFLCAHVHACSRARVRTRARARERGHVHALVVIGGDDVAVAHGADGDHCPVQARHVPGRRTRDVGVSKGEGRRVNLRWRRWEGGRWR